MTVRHQQIEAAIKRAITAILMRRDIADPRMRGMISVTDVSMTPDRKRADIGISVLPDEYEKRVLAALQHAAGHLHARVFKALDMKIVPQFEFYIDRGLKKEAAVLDAIREGMAREGASEPTADDGTADTEHEASSEGRPEPSDPESNTP